MMKRHARLGTHLALALVASALVPTLSIAQESRPAKPIPIDLRLTLVDVAELMSAGHGADPLTSGAPASLADATVELRSRTPAGESDLATTTADENGVVSFQFDARVPGSPYTVLATTTDGRSFASKQQSMASMDDRLNLFEVGSDPTAIQQRIMMTVIPVADDAGQVTKVRVQQLLSVASQSLTAYRGVPELGGGGIVFPVPSGATLTTLNFQEAPVADLTVRDLGERGRGVVVPASLFPNDQALFEGVYELPVTPGEHFTLDLHQWFDMLGFFLFVEEDQLYVAWGEAGDGMLAGLQSLGQQVLQGHERTFLHYQDASASRRGRMVRLPIRFDPGGIPELPPARPMRLEVQLIDLSGLIGASPQHGEAMPDSAEFALANATATLTSFNLDAEEETITATADRNGVVVFELGPRTPGSPFTVTATTGGADAHGGGAYFVSKEEKLADRTGTLNLYRTTDDHGKLRQQMLMNILTVVPGSESDDGRSMTVQVRQVANINYEGVAAYTGPHDADGAGYLFPVPRGATVTSLSFLGEDIVDLTPREAGHWGYGVPILRPIFPLDKGPVIGTYTMEVEKGDVVDLGGTTLVDTGAIQVAWEQSGMFNLDETLLAEWNTPRLSTPRAQSIMGRELLSTFYQPSMGFIPAHEEIKIPVRIGPPPISSRTIWVSLLILGSLSLPVLAGIFIASRRNSVDGLSAQESKLRAMHEKGELTEADLSAELARVAQRRRRLLGEDVAAGAALDGDGTPRLGVTDARAVTRFEASIADLPDEARENARAVLAILRRHVEVPSDDSKASNQRQSASEKPSGSARG